MPVVVGVLVVLLVLVLLGAAISLALNLVGLALMLFIAGVVGWLADAIVPGRLPYGFLGAILAGLVGSWIGQLLLGAWGPSLFGIRLIPALIGAIIVAGAVELLMGSRAERRHDRAA
ncbi:MAG: GlsB/YeaQ/YmgE family stress response membrane protein [Chloroflexi bacterium]|nr:GlsB/YeaQ/YmgE family stress response membrane protein [Chloroflexota bacterium]